MLYLHGIVALLQHTSTNEKNSNQSGGGGGGGGTIDVASCHLPTPELIMAIRQAQKPLLPHISYIRRATAALALYQPRARLLTSHQDSSNMPLTQALYGKKAAALYQQAGAFQAEARTFQLKAKDAYFQANNWAGYDDMRRARQ